MKTSGMKATRFEKPGRKVRLDDISAEPAEGMTRQDAQKLQAMGEDGKAALAAYRARQKR